MTRSYDDFVASRRQHRSVEAQCVADAAKASFEAAYDRDFGIGERIAARRTELCLSQQEVAARAGIPQPEVSRIERGRANPTQATLEKVVAALDARLVLEPTRPLGSV